LGLRRVLIGKKASMRKPKMDANAKPQAEIIDLLYFDSLDIVLRIVLLATIA
jgi:hypothetical protein